MNVWRTVPKHQLDKVETFLRSREFFCVAAASRFAAGTASHVWAAGMGQGAIPQEHISALLLYSHQILYPVFSPGSFPREAPLPRFFSLALTGLHAVQGLAEDVDCLEAALKRQGLVPSVMINYELRSLHADPARLPAVQGPAGLVIRKPEPEDMDGLFSLQLAYEEEEVLPPGAELNPAFCRKTLELLAAGNKMLLAELDGSLAGKINVNAQSFTRFQIGGVYVVPGFRGLGIARAMTAALVGELARRKQDFTLFVKKTNTPARRVYDNLGFAVSGDYRIDYF